MRKQFIHIGILTILVAFISLKAKAQEDIYEELLKQQVAVENPVYMPVIGVGPGVIRYYGDIKSRSNVLIGNKAMKVNISTFFDKKHFYKANFYIIMLGALSGQQYSMQNLQNNLNFRSEFTAFGINAQYSFEHFIKTDNPIHPFVSLGFELLQFSTKTDLSLTKRGDYQYYPDGTIRDDMGNIVSRDYIYETDVRKELDYGMGTYPQNSMAFPLDFGFMFTIADRAYLQVGTSYHFAFSDLIDHISYKNTKGIIGKKGNDKFGFSYVTFHFDLFSDPETITIKRLFADLEFDETMFGDEDYDMVFDRIDRCPGTPDGVPVDSLGCPFDDDMDGIANYKDQEKNTPKGAWVNELGVQVNVDALFKLLNGEAVSREDVKAILKANVSNKYNISNLEIPAKFKKLDSDADGYISFDEVMEAIDDYFDDDGESVLTPADINDLKDFFFAQ